MNARYKVGDRVRSVNCEWDYYGTVLEVYEHTRRETYDVRWDEDGIRGSHGPEWLEPADVPERVYVLRLGSFDGSGPYIRARDKLGDWTITFDQRRAMRFYTLANAELVGVDFGDARSVRLKTRPPAPSRGTE